jgi:hypothetical protein
MAKDNRSKPQHCPRATLKILMAKYKEGMVGIRECENRTIWNAKPDSLVCLSQDSTSCAIPPLSKNG